MALVIAPAGQASAHSLGPSGSTNYRTTLSGVSPHIAGVSVQVLDGGQRIGVSNTTLIPLEILGYSGEPYLMVGASGVWQNVHSSSLYLNRSSSPGLVYMPPGTDAHAPPLWQRVCHCDTVVWHDHRIHWGSNTPPPEVAEDRGLYHLIETWQIHAHQGENNITIRGTLSWVPGPSPAPWLGGVGLAAALVLLIGVLRRWRVPLSVALLALVAVDAARAAGMVAGHSGSFGSPLHAIPDFGIVSLLLWIASILLVPWVLRRHVSAVYAAATIGVILALTDGVPTLSALWHSQIVTAYPTNLQRVFIAATLGIGAGLFAASVVLIDRLDKLKVDTARQTPSQSDIASGKGRKPDTQEP